MIEKPLTEAQRLIGRLEGEFGMASAAIAREIKVKADTVSDIKRRKSTGNLQLYRLRRLMQVMETGGISEENTSDATAPLTSPIVPDFSAVTAGPEPSALTLNAEEPAPAEPKNLKDRASDWLRAAMLGSPVDPSSPSMTAPSRSKKTRSDTAGVEQGDLIEQLVPLAALLFVLSGSVLIPDPYKPCGPNQAEASAIAYPIVKRAVRELDARERLSENTMDAVAILLAMSAYGVRAHGTWQAIHAEEVERARSDRSSPSAQSGADFVAGSGGGHAAAASADAGAGRGIPDAGAPLPFWRGNAGTTREAAGATGRQPSREPASPEQRRADASIDALLAADHAGRLRLGL